MGGILFDAASVHDDRDTAINYQGTWQQSQNSNCYGGTQSISQNTNDSASFTFTGTQVSYIYARQGNLGMAQVTIDGQSVGQIDQYSALPFGHQIATYPGLANISHVITVTVAGTANPQSTGHSVVVDGFITGPASAIAGVVDDTDSSINYGGTWNRMIFAGRYGGTQSFSTNAGDTAAFTFTGTQVSYIYARQYNLGIAQVNIDGKPAETIDQYSPDYGGYQISTYSGLVNTTHTITVTVTNTRNPQSVANWVVVDGFATSIASATSGIRDDRDPAITYGSTWIQSPYPARYGGTQSYSDSPGKTAAFTFYGTQVSYIYARQFNLGIAQVSIDGQPVEQIDQYAPLFFGYQVATYSGLVNTVHTITVSATGTRNPQSPQSFVVVDGFIGNVNHTNWNQPAPTAPAPTTPAPTTPAPTTPAPTTPAPTTPAPTAPAPTAPAPTTPASNPPASSPALSPQSGPQFSGLGASGIVYPQGDCATDDTAALQSMLNARRFIFLDKPVGGCYLISKTLVLQAGSYLFGLSANNPNVGDPASGVVIRLAPNANVGIIRTFDSLQPPGGGNEYMGIENIVFDGNGSQQSAELQGAALVDYRGTFIQTVLRHVLITNAYGPGLFTGSTELDNVWIFGCSTSTYSWIHNPGRVGLGALLVNQVYVEESMKPNGGYQSPWSGNAVNTPANFAHGVWLNGLQSATINQLHCESVATCLDFNDVQTLTIHGITGTRIGNPSSSDQTDQYLMRAMNTNILSFDFTAAYYDQSGSTAASYSNNRVFGLAQGLISNDIYQTPPGTLVWPSYTWGRYDQSYSGVPFLGERAIVGNELWIQQTGTYSPNRLAIFDNTGGPSGSYAYFEREGEHLNLGFSPGPWDQNETHMVRLNFFGLGNSANNVEISGGRIQTGTEENTDMAGELSISSSTSVSYPFKGYYKVHPACTPVPEFSIGAGNSLWITYTDATSFTVNFAIPVTGNISYTCTGRT